MFNPLTSSVVGRHHERAISITASHMSIDEYTAVTVGVAVVTWVGHVGGGHASRMTSSVMRTAKYSSTDIIDISAFYDYTRSGQTT